MDTFSAADYRDGGKRLRATLAAACDPAADFPEQLRSTLDAALGLLASEPDLARLLCVEPYTGDDLVWRAQRRWRAACAAPLRRAALSCPRVGARPLFLEPLLIDGICSLVSEPVRAGQLEQLPALLPDLLHCMLAYYLDSEEVSRIVDATRDSMFAGDSE